MDEVAALAAVRKTGLACESGGATVHAGMGGDGEFFLEWLKNGMAVRQEEFYDEGSLLSSMKKVAPLESWKIGTGR